MPIATVQPQALPTESGGNLGEFRRIRRGHIMIRSGSLGLVALFLLAAAGFGATTLIASAALLAVVGRLAARRWPQTVGSLLAFGATFAAALAYSGIVGPWLHLIGNEDLGVGLVLTSLAVALLVWGVPLRGVHRGWAMALAQSPVWVGLIAAVFLLEHTAMIAGLSLLVSVLVVAGLLRKRTTGDATPRRTTRVVRVVSISLAALFGAMAIGGAAPSAQAWNPFSDFRDEMVCSITSPNTSPQPIGTGPESFVGNYNFAQLRAADGTSTASGMENGVPAAMDRPLAFDRSNLSQYTLYEVAGLRGLKFINWSRNDAGDADCSFNPFISVSLGNLINMVTSWGTQTVIFLKEYSQIRNPFETMFETVTPAVNALIGVAMALLTPLMLFVIIVGFFSVRRQGIAPTLNKTGSIMGTAIILTSLYGGVAAGTVSGNNGTGFLTFTNLFGNVTGSITAGISDSVLSNLPDNENSMCVNLGGGDAMDTAQRNSSCLMAESLAYKPWAKATFGPPAADPIEPFFDPVDGTERIQDPKPEDSPLPCYNNYQDCNDLRSYLIAQAGGPDYTSRLEQCLADAGTEDGDEPAIEANRPCNPYYAVAEDIYQRTKAEEPVMKESGQQMLAAYRGDGSFTHFQHAFTALMSLLIVGIVVGFLAVAVLWKHAELLLLFLFGPVILLVNAAKTDLRGVRDWAKQIAGTFLSLGLYSFMMTMAIFFISMTTSMNLNTGQQLLALALLLFGFFKIYQTMNSRLNSATGNEDAPGMDRGANIIKGAAAAGVGYGAVRTLPGVARAVPGAGRAVGRGLNRVADATVKPAGEKMRAGAGHLGGAINRNTQGVQNLAGQAAGGAAAGMGIAAARAKQGVAESRVGQSVKNAGDRIRNSDTVAGVKETSRQVSDPIKNVGSKIRGQAPADPDTTAFAAGRAQGRHRAVEAYNKGTENVRGGGRADDQPLSNRLRNAGTGAAAAGTAGAGAAKAAGASPNAGKAATEAARAAEKGGRGGTAPETAKKSAPTPTPPPSTGAFGGRDEAAKEEQAKRRAERRAARKQAAQEINDAVKNRRDANNQRKDK